MSVISRNEFLCKVMHCYRRMYDGKPLDVFLDLGYITHSGFLPDVDLHDDLKLSDSLIARLKEAHYRDINSFRYYCNHRFGLERKSEEQAELVVALDKVGLRHLLTVDSPAYNEKYYIYHEEIRVEDPWDDDWDDDLDEDDSEECCLTLDDLDEFDYVRKVDGDFVGEKYGFMDDYCGSFTSSVHNIIDYVYSSLLKFLPLIDSNNTRDVDNVVYHYALYAAGRIFLLIRGEYFTSLYINNEAISYFEFYEFVVERCSKFLREYAKYSDAALDADEVDEYVDECYLGTCIMTRGYADMSRAVADGMNSNQAQDLYVGDTALSLATAICFDNLTWFSDEADDAIVIDDD